MVVSQLCYSLLFCLVFWYLREIFQFQWANRTKKINKLGAGWHFLLSEGCSGSHFWADTNTRALQNFGKFLLVIDLRKILPAPWFSKGITKSLGTMTSCLFEKRRFHAQRDVLEKNSIKNQLWITTSTLTAVTQKAQTSPKNPLNRSHSTPELRAELDRRGFCSKFILDWMFWWTCLFYNKYFPPKIMELSVSFQALSSPQAPERAMVF